MDLIQCVRSYTNRMIEKSGQGMKALVMDHETVGMISVTFSQTEIINKEVFLFELIDSCGVDKLPHLTCIYFLRPTETNVAALCKELQDPRYGSYFIYFSNVIDRNYVRQLAEADEKESVEEIQEFFFDYLALSDFIFSLNVPMCCKGDFLWDDNLLKRCTQGILSVLLSLKRCPNIRYQATSDMCKLLADKLTNAISREASLFHFNSSDSPVLLIVDRREDAVTPILNQWTYQAMVHEILGLKRNRVSTNNFSTTTKDMNEIVLNAESDEFYAQNLYKNFGEIAINIKALMENFQEKHKSQSKIESIDDMKAFVQSYPQFKKLSGTVTKHVTLISELSKQVSSFGLMDVSETEQQIICQRDRTDIFAKIKNLLSREDIRDIDALRLVSLYALRDERLTDNELGTLIKMLEKRNLSTKWMKFLKVLPLYGGLSFRQSDLFNNQSTISLTKQFIKGLRGVENVYCQYKPLIVDIIDSILKGKLKESSYPFINPNVPTKEQKITDLIVFCVGGITYEEACAVHEMPKYGVRILLGGSDVHNFKSFIDEVLAASSKSIEIPG